MISEKEKESLIQKPLKCYKTGWSTDESQLATFCWAEPTMDRTGHKGMPL